MSNVHDQLSKTKPSLVNRIIQNQQVTGMLMGFINVFHGLRVIANLPVETLEFGPIEELKDNEFVCSMSFNPSPIIRTARWKSDSELHKYAQSRAAHFAETLRLNPNIERWIISVVDTLERWASTNGCSWENVEIDQTMGHQAVVTKDLQKIRFRVKKKLGLTLARA